MSDPMQTTKRNARAELEAEPVTISRADFNDYEAMRSALRDILNWRGAINENPAFVMSGLLGDAEGLAVALFNGPIWDEAERTYR